MVNKYVGAGQAVIGVGKKVIQKVFGKKSKVSPDIKSVAPNVPVTKADKVKRDLRLATQKSKTSQVKLDNTIFRIEQQKKRLEDMQKTKSQTQTRPGKMGGGFMGKRMGYKKGTGLMKKKSNVEKIKETFDTKKKKKKKFPDLTGDGKVTFADILKGRGVINGKKKKKVI